MLTRKQQFRRQVLKKQIHTRYDHNYIYAEGTSRYYDNATPIRTSSLPTVGTPNSLTHGRTWQTTGDLNNSEANQNINPKKLKDKISFNNAVRVVLIPTREEYRAAGLSDVMWWEDKDYAIFKESALAELRNLVLQRGKMDTKTALNILYQPNPNNIREEKVDNLTITITSNDLPPPPPPPPLLEEIKSPPKIVHSGLDSCKKPSVVILSKIDNEDNNVREIEQLPNVSENSVLADEYNFK